MMLHPWSRSSGIQTSVCFSKATTASRTLRVVKNLDSVRKARRSNVPDVKRIVCFHSPCIEDHSGAVDFKLIFGVVKYLNPWFGCWEPYWVDKWPLWSKRPRGASFNVFRNRFINNVPRLILCKHLFNQVNQVAMLSDEHILCTEMSKWEFELQEADSVPNRTVFWISSPGLYAGGEFYLAHRPDRLLFRSEPPSRKTYWARGLCCLCEFWLGGPCITFDSNCSRRSLADTLSTTCIYYDPSYCSSITTATHISKWRAWAGEGAGSCPSTQ